MIIDKSTILKNAMGYWKYTYDWEMNQISALNNP